MDLRAIDTQKKIKEMFINSYHKNLISHAYIFEGKEDAGTFDMALFLSALLITGQEDINNPEVQRIIKGEHPNLFVISPDGQNIKKEQIVNLQTEFTKTPFYDLPRVYIIKGIDKLNISSANSLLKFIEEPTNKNSYGILLCEDTNYVLPTIKSRCQIVNFYEPSYDTLYKLFSEVEETKKLAKILPYFCVTIEEANELLAGSFSSLLDLLISYTDLLITKPEESTLLLIDNSSLLWDKANFQLYLNFLSLYFGDVIKYNRGIKSLIFGDYLDTIKKYALIMKNDIEKVMEIILNIESRLRYNVAIKMLILRLGISLENEVKK